ncbi:hypothetical protein EWM64_g2149 [Hericium alpestre]|uniref:Uncharacterized protein n=1 Tax=Hericium alpestre TaxID=135208 RepID=A0A4Z0A684_9AGAM|nr:hypothetical protein EWM64_g2149 [Hericium alpestre]
MSDNEGDDDADGMGKLKDEKDEGEGSDNNGNSDNGANMRHVPSRTARRRLPRNTTDDAENEASQAARGHQKSGEKRKEGQRDQSVRASGSGIQYRAGIVSNDEGDHPTTVSPNARPRKVRRTQLPVRPGVES